MDSGENVSESVHFQTKRISVTLAENSDCLLLSLIGRLSRAKFTCTKRARTKTNKKTESCKVRHRPSLRLRHSWYEIFALNILERLRHRKKLRYNT